MAYRFEIDKTAITIFHWQEGSEPKDSHKHFISLLNLKATRNEDLASDLITHISEKSWSNKKMLYELAAIVQNLSPENNIDWLQTFLPIEGEYSIAPHIDQNLVLLVNKSLNKYNVI